MNLLEAFKEFLFSQDNRPSKVTVKNYLSDVNHFIRWYESKYEKPFDPQNVNHQTINLYKQQVSSISYDVSGENESKIPNTKYQILSQRSLERHLSSLRKFFKFLKLEGHIGVNPFEQQNAAKSAFDKYKLKDFKNYLYVYNASHLTIKNYVIDIKQFFAWAEEVLDLSVDNGSSKLEQEVGSSKLENQTSTFKHQNPASSFQRLASKNNVLSYIDSNLLEEYKKRLINEGNFSPSTVNRKLSSLRKYLNWAMDEKLVSGISYPFGPSSWRGQVSSIQKPQTTGLREFAYKLQDEAKSAGSADTKYKIQNTKYSRLAPIRLLQKLSEIGIFAFDQFLTLPFTKAFNGLSYLVWLAKGRPVFKKVSGISYKVSRIKSARSLSVDNILNTKYKILNTTPKVKNLPKEFYAPLDISTKYFPWYKKIWFTLRYKRPKWYATYHSYAITHYFHFAILIIFMAVIGFGFYQSFFQKPTTGQPTLAAGLPNAPLHILSFQGRLTDNQDNPISTSSAMRFAIYNAQAPASGSALLWQEVNSVSPDQDGIFSVLLGNVTAIPQWLFASNSALFLGVTVNTTPEMTPRQQLATVAFAANSELLQGLPPIVQANAGTTNVILALDSSGNLTIGGTANPTFQASGGQFTISGQPLLLTTNAGSNGNIQLAPEGLGKIDLTKPLVNTSISNNISTAVGSVEVDDLFSILATSSGQSAFTLNQDGAGPLISASASGVAKFTVGNSGSLTSANYTNAGGIIYTQTSGLLAQNAAGTTSDCLIGGTSPSFSSCAGASAGSIFWNQASGALFPKNSTVDLLIGGQSTTSAKFALINIAGARGLQTASVSGSLTLDSSTASIQTTNNQLLTLGGNTTGQITLSALNGTQNIRFAGYTTAGCTLKADTNGLITCGTDNTGGAGSSPFAEINGAIVANNTTEDFTFGSQASVSARFRLTANILGAGTLGVASISGKTSFATLVVNNDGVGDLFTASSSGWNKFVIKGNGNVGIGTTSPTALLDIAGSASLSGNLAFNGTGTNNVYLLNNSSLAFLGSVGGTDAGATTPSTDIGAFSTTSQGQLPQILQVPTSANVSIGGTNYVYVLGGFNATYQSTVYKSTVDTSGNLGTFSTASQGQLPQLLGHFTTVTSTIGASTYVYVLGGFNGTSSRSTVYKATVDTSGNIGAFSTASQGQLPQAFDSHTTVTSTIGASTYVYVLGGNGGTDLSTVYKATIDTSGNIGTFSTASQGQLPQLLRKHTTVTATIGGTNYVYVLGGFNTTTAQSTVYKATVDTSGNIGTFSTASQAQLPQILNNHTSLIATVSGTNYIYVLGGSNAGASQQSTAYKAIIDTSGNIGTFSTASQGQLPQVLEDHTVSAVSIGGTDYLYVIGGNTTADVSQSTVYKSTLTGGVSAPGPSTVLTIKNNGTLIAPTYATCTLKTDSTGLFTCGTDNTGVGTSPFTENASLKIIIQNNTTEDFLLGGTATASAKFAFINMAGGSPTASISGNLSLAVPTGSNPSALFNILNGGNLNFQTSVGGDAGLATRLYIANNGNIGIGTSNPQAKLDIGGSSSTITNTSGDITITPTANLIISSGKVGINATSPLSTLDVRPNTTNGGTISVASVSGKTSFAALVANNDGVGDLFTASSSGTNKFTVKRTGELLAPAYATCTLKTDSTGLFTCGTDNTGGAGSSPFAEITGGIIVPNNSTVDFLVGGQSTSSAQFAVLNIAKNQAVASVSGQFIVMPNNGWGGQVGIGTILPTDFLQLSPALTAGITQGITLKSSIAEGASSNFRIQYVSNGGVQLSSLEQRADAGYGLRLKNNQQGGIIYQAGASTNTGNTHIWQANGTTEYMRLDSAGRLGLNTNSPLGTLDIRGNTTDGGTIAVASASGKTSFAALVANNDGVGDLFTASSSGTNKFTVQRNGLLLAPTYNATGCTLKADTNGLITCGVDNNSGGTGNSPFAEITGGVIVPNNSTVDFLIGGQSTTAAKFALINIAGARGLQTASLSGSLTLDSSTASIQTTKNQLLTVGGNSTGNIVLSPLNGTGRVGINTSNPTSGLDVVVTSGLRSFKGFNSGDSEARIELANEFSGGGGILFGAGGGSAPDVSLYRGGVNILQTDDTLAFNGVTTDITTGTNEHLAIAPNGTGKIGLFTTSPLASFDVRNNSVNGGTLAVASVSGTTSFAALVANNDGVGDLFTASSSGTNKFTVKRTGELLAPAYATCTLKTDSTGLFTCGTDNTGGAGTSPFAEITGGIIVPNNSTVDFLVGGQATTAAKFALINIAGARGLQTASLSGSLTLDSSTASIQTTNNQLLTVGGNTTGNITIAPLNGAAGSLLTVNAITTALSGTTTLTASSLATFTTAASLGITATTLTLGNGSAATIQTTTNGLTLDSGSNTLTIAATDTTLTASGLTTFTLGTNPTINAGATALNLQADGTPDVNIAGGSGTTGCTISNSTGNLTCSGNISGTTTGVQGYWQRTLGSLAPTNITDDLLLGTIATSTAQFSISGIAKNQAVASLSGQLIVMPNNGWGGNVGIGNTAPSSALSVNGVIHGYGGNGGLGEINLSNSAANNGGRFQIRNETGGWVLKSVDTSDIQIEVNNTLGRGITIKDTTGNVGIGTTSPLALLDVRGTSGTLTVASVSGQTSFAALVANNDGVGDLFTASSSGTNKFTVQRNGLLLAPTYNATGCTLKADTNGLITCGVDNNSGGSGSSPFAEITGGIIVPNNSTVDFLVGGQSTTAAKFAFMNIAQARGNQIASISGSLTLDSSTATIQTTQNQALTIGGNTTGNININPLNGTGTLTVNGTIYSKAFYDVDNSSYFLDPAATNNSLIVAGNVGIGTTTPTAKLDVVGSASISANLAFRGTGTNNVYLLNNSSLAFLTSPGGPDSISTTTPSTDIGAFSTTGQGQLPQVLQAAPTSESVSIGGTNYVYVLGGWNASAQSTVYKSTVDTSGNLGTFSTASQGQLPATNFYLSSDLVTQGGTSYVYVLGGYNGTTTFSTVYKATIDTSGNLGTFSTASQGQLAQTSRVHSSEISTIGGTSYVYVLGGYNGTTTFSTVYKATIDTSGNIGAFSTASQGQLPQVLREHSSSIATVGGTSYIYVLGGFNGTTSQSTVYKATIDTSGNIGAFSTASQGQLPQVLNLFDAVVITVSGTNYIYVLGGGDNGTNQQSTVYKATVDTSGNIGTFSTASQGQLPQVLEDHAVSAVSIGGTDYLYVIGGNTTADASRSTVYKSTLTGGGGSAGVSPDAVLTIENSGTITIGDKSAQSVSAWATARDDAAYEKAESLAVYNGYLYAGFGISAGDGDIYYTSDGSTWTASFTSATFTAFKAMTVYNGKLYAAGSDATNAIVYVCTPSTAGNANICDDNTDWAASYTDAAGHDTALSLAVFNGKLYAGLGTGADDGDVFEFNGTSWAASLSQAGYETISSMAVFNGSLYAGHGNNTAGDADVKRFDGTAWSATFAYTDSATYMEVRSLAVYNGKLYMGTGATTADFGDLYVCDPSAAGATGDWLVCDANADWDNTLSTDAFNAAQNIPSMATYNGKLYAGLSGAAAGDDGDIWVLNGSNWSISQANTGYDSVPSLIEYNGKLFAGLGTGTGDGDIQTYTEARSTTYPLKFAVGSGASEIAGNLWFDKEDLYGTWGGQGANVGVFKLSHALISNAGAYDIAEDYPTRDDSLKPGNIVSVDTNEKGFIKKTSKPYDKNIVGVLSNKPGLRLSQTEQTIAGGSVIPVALVGRVPVSVSTENGPIKPGDYLTSSSIPGAAMKATRAGEVIGKALEPFSCQQLANSNQPSVTDTGSSASTSGSLLASNGSTATSNVAEANVAAANFGLVAPSQNYCTGNIVVFINVGYNDPTPILTTLENLKDYTFTKLASQGDALRSYAYQVTDTFGNTVSRAEVLAGLVVGNLRAGAISASQIFADAIQTNLINADKIISPIAQIDTIHTNLISPLGQDSKIALKLENDKLSILNGNSATSSAVSSFDNQGNATFSGRVSANQLSIRENLDASEASISGTLRARKIIADQIEGLNLATSNQQSATSSLNYITNVTNIYNSTQSASPNVSGISYNVSSDSGILNTKYDIQNTGYIDIASYSGLLANVGNLNAATATFSQGLMSFGSTSLSDTSVVGQLSIDGNLILASNSINVLGGDLQLQPLRQGGLSVMAGLFYIDTNGDVKIEGNATVKGTLYANVISPIPGNDLAIHLGGVHSSTSEVAGTDSSDGEKLVVNNASNSAILAINQLGDLVASGSGTFGKLNLSLIQPAFALSTTEVIATGSAGTASIRARQTELTINNPLVTDKSLIYVTPKSNQIIYLMRQVPGVSFTVGVSTPTYVDILFNWIIVN